MGNPPKNGWIYKMFFGITHKMFFWIHLMGNANNDLIYLTNLIMGKQKPSYNG